MSKMKAKRIIKEIMKSYDNARKVSNVVMETKKVMHVPRVNLSDILLKMNENEILINQEVEVSGYLSNLAYFEFPSTYTPATIGAVYGNKIENENNFVSDTQQFAVKELYPPLYYSPCFEKNKMLCFLYFDPNCLKVNIILENKKYMIRTSEKNKYVPVLIDKSIFQKYKNSHIRAIVQVNNMNTELERLFSGVSDPEYKKMVEYFFNPGYIDIKGIILTLHDLEIEDESHIEKVYYNYGIEFSFANQPISESDFIKK